MPTILSDHEIAAGLTPIRAVAWIREALLDAHHGRLHTPPRVSTDLGEGRLVFTAGALEGEWFGYRSYDSFGKDVGEQVIVVHEWATGAVQTIAISNELGPRRVGAIGAAAADVLANPNAITLGLIGTGVQALTQLLSVAAVRELTDVAVYSRDPVRRKAFCARVNAHGVQAHPVESARAAVVDRELVLLATNSPVPVIDPAWIADGAFVATLGPKQRGRAEFGPELIARADLAVTDSVAQTHAYDPPYILLDSPEHERLVSLGAILAGERLGRTDPNQVVVFCSVGLAGTEAYLLNRLVRDGVQ
ncbi:ornithine cyclodeaminase family protein [Kribbella deserti]|uniref:Ornithine cyclodeaminase family protein n=1 Tax=Kribbella deserti TaxID=1926257 RepID=A0ABV6QUW8_9ACTN